jgi:ring-1,2-phenylacetyl-CoA epoxidase subunit PaaA
MNKVRMENRRRTEDDGAWVREAAAAYAAKRRDRAGAARQAAE